VDREPVDLARDRLGGALIEVGDDHRSRALRSESARQRASDAAARAGDHYVPVG
jgi:hypothetical protein